MLVEPATPGAIRYSMAKRPLSFVDLPTEIKHCVLVHAMGTDNNTAASDDTSVRVCVRPVLFLGRHLLVFVP